MKWNYFLSSVLAICISLLAQGQESQKSDKPVTIKGKVLNLKNQPVSGACLYIDNIKTSTITKEDGTYKLKVSPTALNLEARSSEYGSSIVLIDGHTTINFLLEGGKDLMAAADSNKVPVTTVKHKAKKMNTYSNIYEMIRCEVSGVTVNGHSVQIQQAHSFFGSSTPLFVINGVIVQSIDNVNPVEVKSIGLLKGSSAAIYGVNGSNGVISITLKSGSDTDK